MQITLDTTDLLDASDRLRVLDATTLSELRRATVDVVALSVRKKAVSETVKQLNLTRDYVEARIERDETRARGDVAEAKLRSQVRGTTLQRFGIRQETKRVNTSNADIMQLTGKFGFAGGVAMGAGRSRPYAIGPQATLPNGVKSRIWTQRMGDPSRGIPPDMKANGISVDVNRKGAKRIATAFTLPLLNNNGAGVFQRQGGKIKHLYGPSVYQTFRRHIAENQQSIADEMRDTFMDGLDDRLRKL